MSSIEKTAVEQLLSTFIDPNHGLDLVSAKSVKSIEINDESLTVNLELGYPANSIIESLQTAVHNHLSVFFGWQIKIIILVLLYG